MGALVRHRWWVLGAILVVLAATLAVVRLVPRRFTAGASVWLDHPLDGRAGARGAGPAPDAVIRRNTEAQFLTSTAVVMPVVDALGLADVRGVGQPLRGPRLPPAQARQQAIRALVDGVVVEPQGTSDAVVARFTAANPVVAAGIVNRLVDQYVAFRAGAAAPSTAATAAEAGAARDAMIRAEAAADAYRTAVAGRDRGLLPPPRPRWTRPVSPALDELRAERDRLVADRAALEQRYGPRHPAMLAADGRIAEANGAIAAETERAGRAAARAWVARRRARVALAEDARVDAQRLRLDGETRAARTRYLALVAADRRQAAARPRRTGAYIIAHAPVPAAPDAPSPRTVAIVGVLAALAAGALAAALRDRLAPGFRNGEAAERRLGLPVIGAVPDRARLREAREAGTAPVDLILHHGRSAFGAALNGIVAGLELNRGEHGPRSVAVTSAVAGEGKTTVAVSLARAVALAGRRVLLVDCDTRLPAASAALAPDAGHDLAEVLNGAVPLDRAVTRDAASGAWVLASRAGEPAAAAGLVGSRAMRTFLAEVAGRYDLVVLDTAPVLALAETRVVAAYADRVLLVARWRTTPARATRLALDTLCRAGATVAALALTRVGA